MRLIETSTLRLVSKYDGAVPPYAILSHTWGTDEEEVNLQEWQSLPGGIHGSRLDRQLTKRHPVAKKKGFAKIRDAARLAELEGYQYLWVDTCCIDKTSSAELSEAINSMFRWYRNAAVCYALLSDVDYELPPDAARSPGDSEKTIPYGYAPPALMKAIMSSRWFKRGWTLQELIAPKDVFFYSKQWFPLGSKRRGTRDMVNPEVISDITEIDLHVLQSLVELEDVSVASRMRWAANRDTTRVEDKAYCLMGIFGVNMPLLYGEGDRAFIRLQEEILKSTDDQSIFAWKCPMGHPLQFQLSGLLASSPSFFAATGLHPRMLQPLPRDPSRVSAPSSMTNAGLHVRLLLKTIDPVGGLDKKIDETSREVYGVLGCAPYIMDGVSYRPAISLTSLGGDQYARAYPDRMLGLDDRSLANMQPGEGFQYIYVKQLSAPRLPEITLGPFTFKPRPPPFSETPVKILAAYPPDAWDESALTLRPTVTLSNTVLGAFRYSLASLDGRLGDAVDVLVGLRPGIQGPRMVWCAQQKAFAGHDLEDAAIDFNGVTITHTVGAIPEDYHLLFNVIAKVETMRMPTRSTVHLSLSEYREGSREVFFGSGHSKPLRDFELESDRNKIIFTPMGPSLQDAQPVVIDESWDTGLGFGLVEKSQARLWTGIRVMAKEQPKAEGKPGDPNVLSQDYWSLRHLVASLPQPVEIRLEDDPQSGDGGDYGMHVQRYFSLLLTQACARNDMDSATELLRSPLSNATVEVQTCLQTLQVGRPSWHSAFRKFRPIHWAVLLGHRDILRLLLAHGADVLSTTGTRVSAIHLAVIMGRIELLQDLLAAVPENWEKTKPDWFETTGAMEPLAHLVASYITSHAVAGLLESFMRTAKGSDSREAAVLCTNALYNTLHETPLHRAAANGNLAAAKAILALAQMARTDVDAKDYRGRTPFWHAAASGAHDIAELLLHHGADRTVRDDKGWTPFHAGCRGGHARIVQLLLDHDDDGAGLRSLTSEGSPFITVFHLALFSGDADTLRILLTCGLVKDPNQGFPWFSLSFTPLHVAVSNGWLGCVQVLCEAGCAITEVQTYGGFVDGLIVEPQGLRPVPIRVPSGTRHTKISLRELAGFYDHRAIVDYMTERGIGGPPPERSSRKSERLEEFRGVPEQ
ncbi:hypothetical protein B0J18DRAFT_69947 [Chaetomium sp. MPI-SDFR-AT-0129]|nr:hypothetical protein B0J18DRAFT_69947 [Chaetomium sp. MPI-SDFR-AT-0129]